MPTITLSQDDLPVDSWEEGEHYKATLILRQSTPTNEGEAEFEVVRGTGRPATNSEIEPEEDMTFEESAQKAKQEVVEPSTGAEAQDESQSDNSPAGYRT